VREQHGSRNQQTGANKWKCERQTARFPFSTAIYQSTSGRAKLSVAAAAETVIANYIYDPVCDYGHSVRILRDVLRAWAELELAKEKTHGN